MKRSADAEGKPKAQPKKLKKPREKAPPKLKLKADNTPHMRPAAWESPEEATRQWETQRANCSGEGDVILDMIQVFRDSPLPQQ